MRSREHQKIIFLVFFHKIKFLIAFKFNCFLHLVHGMERKREQKKKYFMHFSIWFASKICFFFQKYTKY
jgi:hypothetical protein